ncbi:uncharacterized protein BCR38DRAFT_482154 [Pseudomassariella vexata]|uniref:Uncharacterized protein n=1 Tax=Pseudomassariella vexata TaxID=1141098 RepID=A0A1Y2EAS9_9PEZI|nr:uncharacterized protein BCR38DRAFT_482154 [Pseudomassariella vexata]ORY68652.1 hypothetical protein BCR38DRAFT_482154 [Pseudomassariella vexata]
MLRRPPTTLTLTSEDTASYEDRRAAATHQTGHPILNPGPRSFIPSSATKPTILDRHTQLQPPQPRPGLSVSPPGSTEGLNFGDYASSSSEAEVDNDSSDDQRHQQRRRRRVAPSQQSDEAGDDDEDEDEEMADYDLGVAGQIQSLPAAARQPHHQQQHQPHHRAQPQPIATSRPGAVTPTAAHPTAAATHSHIPQAPSRPPPASSRATSMAAATQRHMRIAGPGWGAAQTGIQQAQTQGQMNPPPPPAPVRRREGTAEPVEGRVTRSREERIGVAGRGRR